jgi:hypothetical protein
MEKVTVCIWMPSGIYTKLGIGHAAIKLTASDGKKHYITWAAQGNPLKAPFKFQRYPRYENLGTKKFGYVDDKANMEGFFGQQEPHYKIKLPVLELSNGKLTYGVSASRIAAFWKVQRKETMYAFLSAKYNCTGIVWEALKAGGLGYYHGIDDSIFIQGAAGLLDAVNKAHAHLSRLNQLTNAIANKMGQLQQQHPNVPKKVPTIAEWKTSSDQNVKYKATHGRKDQVAALDKLIDDYPNAKTDTIKFAMLSRMQSEIYSHLTNKQNSDRKLAVEQLGASITVVLKSLPGNLDLDALTDGHYRWVMNTLGWRSHQMSNAGFFAMRGYVSMSPLQSVE